jgi:hypothetical protein
MKKKLTQTRGWTVIGAAAILIAAASPARAEQRLIADVPFEFVVGNSRLPAGHYVVTESDDPALVSIANTNGHDFTFVLTIAGSRDERSIFVDQPELVFMQYGGQRFLSQIVTSGSEEREIPLKASAAAEKIDHVALVSFR